LWNLAYNHVLRTVLPAGSTVVCYADDTIVLAGGQDWGEATARSDVAVACVMRSIQEMELEVATRKTETVFFHNGSHGPPPPTSIRVGEARVQVGEGIKYLGLHLDTTWSFGEHFRRLTPRVEGEVMALSRLLPNLGGPDRKVRRVYAAVVSSMALYGAPVWAEEVAVTGRLKDLLRRLQRRVALRTARAYRTVSHATATVLAGVPSLELAAKMYAKMYREVRGLRERGVQVTPRHRRTIKDQARRNMILEWQRSLENLHLPRRRTVEAIRPCLPEWVERVRGGLTFRMTQVLTGHGCFGEYLCRIGKERTTECHHCGHPRDSAQHTLESCPAWAAERGDLMAAVGADLSLPAVLVAAVGSVQAWKSLSFFCGKVMLQKEDAERERRGEARRGTPPNPSRDRSMPPPDGGPPPRRRRHRSPHHPPPSTHGER